MESTDVRVGQTLSLTVSSNKACELQLLYVEATGDVESIPQAMIGPAMLEPGEKRIIPAVNSGRLVFDQPAYDETLLLYCKEGGLGEDRLAADQAKKLISSSNQPPARGIAIILAEKGEGNPSLASHLVSFQVRP